MIKVITDPDEVFDFIYKYSCNDKAASYPRMKSKEKISRNLERALTLENRMIIANYDDELLGVCCFHWDNDNYAQASIFLVKDSYEYVADEMICFIQNKLPKYNLLIGIPDTNAQARDYFEKKNLECIESSIVMHQLNLECAERSSNHNINRITKTNFDLYKDFHNKFAVLYEMYYTSEKLLDVIERFEILTFNNGNKIVASIFANKGKDLTDIVGLFIEDDYKNKDIESLLFDELRANLVDEFGKIGEVLYFAEDEKDVELASVAGFKIKESYKCYEKAL